MKFSDLLRMSSSNLLRRKLRTALTVLGVVIGTASIVVMISLGLGLQKSSMEQIEQYGGLTTINVNTWGNSGGSNFSDSSSDTEELRIDDALAEKIAAIPHVEVASPVLSVNVLAKQGVYMGDLQVQGMTQEGLKALNLNVGEGSLPSAKDGLQFFYGNQVITNFYNSQTNEYYWENNNLADVDFMKDPIFVIFDTDAYYNAQNGGDGSGQTAAPPKKYIIPTSGVMAGTINDYSEGSYNVYADIDQLKAMLKKVFKGKAIPGQPTNKSGKPYKEIYYDQLYVKVDNIENVQEVQKTIQDMGYGAESNAEWMQQTKDQMKMIQLVLGGIGAVSLFVAAIGIANTMMMSIYERTKEIGIIKVLGCDMNDIRTMFLMEAGFIGFFGGLIGLILSGTISAIINMIAGGADGSGYYSGISYIPPWLILAALAFAVLVGMLAGFFPALRAMRLSPLAAIRNE